MLYQWGFVCSTPGGSLYLPPSQSKETANSTAADIIAMALKKKFANTSVTKSFMESDSPRSPLVEPNSLDRRFDYDRLGKLTPSSPLSQLSAPLIISADIRPLDIPSTAPDRPIDSTECCSLEKTTHDHVVEPTACQETTGDLAIVIS
jgi:hypothetical protein